MIETLRCRSCGNALTEDADACAACGTSVAPVSSETRIASATEAGVRLTDGDDLLLDQLQEHTVGEYEVRGLLGRGGMASVFVAYDLSLNRKVALKVMHPGHLGDPGMRERFKMEAQLAAQLDHPNIVTVHAVKQRGPILFFDLKLIDGASLDRVLRHHRQPLPPDIARWVTAKIAEALHYAHAQGIVHRDIKPANVMVDLRGEPTVTDFGIARAAESPHLTKTGAVVGTPAYMSPEQCLGKDTSPATDQYSLGVLTYELLTGRVPFGGTMLAIQLGHVEQMPTAPHSLAPMPSHVSAIVMRMMAKDAQHRWPTLLEAAAALREGLTISDADARSRLGRLVDSTPRVRLGEFPVTPMSPQPVSVNSAPTDSLRGPVSVFDAATAPLTQAGAVPAEVRGSRTALRRGLQAVAVLGVAALVVVAVATAGRGLTGADAGLNAGAANSALDVSDSTVARVAVDPLSVSLAVGDSLSLNATAYGPSGERVSHRILWSSADTSIVRIHSDGWIRAMKRGGPVFVNAMAGPRIGVAVVTVH